MTLNFFKENTDGNIIDARWFYRSKIDCQLEIRFKDHLKVCKTVSNFYDWVNHFDKDIDIRRLNEFKGRIQKIETDYLIFKAEQTPRFYDVWLFMKPIIIKR